MKKRLLFILTFLLVFLIISTIVFFSIKVPPLGEMNRARKNLAAAQKIKSSKYASELLQKASINYDLAMKEWNKENEKLIFFRDYKKARENAEQANKLSLEAIAKTKNNISNAKESLGQTIAKLKNKIHDFDTKYKHFPYNSKNNKELSKSKLLLNEAVIAYKQSNYNSAKAKLDSADALITQLHTIYEERLENYFNEYSLWQKWVDQSINYSKKNNAHSIVVDKFARECTLYKNGKIQNKFDIELGPNWLGNKKQQGDKSTPEGIYEVVRKMQNGKTKYYKALLLDYPNEDDKKRFLFNKRKGLIKPNAKIGNLIEIHGNGGQGIDWTDGCVAINDSEMDKLFSACPEGTKVAIVGSAVPLNKLFSSKQ